MNHRRLRDEDDPEYVAPPEYFMVLRRLDRSEGAVLPTPESIRFDMRRSVIGRLSPSPQEFRHDVRALFWYDP